MLTKAKSLYQVKLILDCLPEEEYELIPQETIDYIENNYKYDENIVIDPEIPLENQEIDDKTYEFLDKVLKNLKEVEIKQEEDTQIKEYISKVKEENEIYNTKIEIIKLKEKIELLKQENSKIPKAKVLLEEYKELVNKKDKEISSLKENNMYLKQT